MPTTYDTTPFDRLHAILTAIDVLAGDAELRPTEEAAVAIGLLSGLGGDLMGEWERAVADEAAARVAQPQRSTEIAKAHVTVFRRSVI